MGTSTILRLDSKWELRDIIKILERTQNDKVKVTAHADSLTGCYDFALEKLDRRIFVITNSRTPIGMTTYMSLGANAQAVQIFRDVANVFGGLLLENDYDSKSEMINGKLNPEDGIPFFAKYLIVNGIESDDYKGFIDGVNKFERTIGNKPLFDAMGNRD
jgi:hypothetical protein